MTFRFGDKIDYVADLMVKKGGFTNPEMKFSFMIFLQRRVNDVYQQMKEEAYRSRQTQAMQKVIEAKPFFPKGSEEF